MHRRRFCALICALAITPGRGQAAVLHGRAVWREERADFGGFSAIHVTEGGAGFLALSDRGTLWRGRLLRDGAGRLTGARAEGAPVRLRGVEGQRLSRRQADAEGLAVDAAGRIVVAFEGLARVRAYPDPAGPAEALPAHPDWAGLPPNAALEALAVAPNGTLFALPEEAGADLPVYRLRPGGRWQVAARLERSGGFRAVGADIGPDGRLWLLERDLRGLAGFAARVRAFALPDPAGETVLETAPGTHGNLEGLSVWRDGAGGLRLSLIADNNFLPFLPCEIVEYAISA